MIEATVTNVAPHNICSSINLVLPKARTSLYSIDNVRFVCQKLLQALLKEIKEVQTREIFERNIKARDLGSIAKVGGGTLAGFLQVRFKHFVWG